ncbi:hypothetical protein L596_004334 [Steinernema carpocapsae]|uniref:Uncharacterized protein n=1 Tax=Steinernema carpocapsae TaxID=34508 RepID=A0A4U8UZ29_STECR|nr:hypothetical protein L596_004334 [Steinernema carpocapsae]
MRKAVSHKVAAFIYADGYAELPALNHRNKPKKETKDFRKSYHYDEHGRPADPWPASARPPRSTVSSAQSNPFTTTSLSEYRLRNSTDDSSGIVTSASSLQPSPTTPAEEPKALKARQRAPNPPTPSPAEIPTSPLSSAHRDESRSVGTHYESRSFGRQQTGPAESFEEEDLFDEPSVKVTPEALAILERNARMYSSICKETVDGSAGDALIRNEEPKRAAAHEKAAQIPSQKIPLLATKRETTCSSSMSSVTTGNMRGGEDIDFSWVNDMQNSLDHEFIQATQNNRRRVSSPECVPVCYFGMDTPVMECLPKGVSEKAALTKPTTLPGEKFDELKQIHSNVRSKAAMFDSEAQKNERKLMEQRQAAQRYKSRSTPRLIDHEDPYIPRPDYGSNNNQQISIDTRPPPPPYQHQYFGDSRREKQVTSHTLSPSARRIRRSEGGNQFTNPKVHPQMCPEVVQNGRAHNSAEYYRQNAHRNSETSWRTSVAY